MPFFDFFVIVSIVTLSVCALLVFVQRIWDEMDRYLGDDEKQQAKDEMLRDLHKWPRL